MDSHYTLHLLGVLSGKMFISIFISIWYFFKAYTIFICTVQTLTLDVSTFDRFPCLVSCPQTRLIHSTG